ncbi:MAG: hypothetical protein Q8865_04655 [Bacillota bacterium]|nr:hypothetical protein [Bacillota bacterium]
MRKFIYLLFFLTFLFSTACAKTPAIYHSNIKDAVKLNYPKLVEDGYKIEQIKFLNNSLLIQVQKDNSTRLYLYDTIKRRLHHLPFKVSSYDLNSATVLTNNNIFIKSPNDSAYLLINGKSLKIAKTLKLPKEIETDVAISPDGTTLAYFKNSSLYTSDLTFSNEKLLLNNLTFDLAKYPMFINHNLILYYKKASDATSAVIIDKNGKEISNTSGLSLYQSTGSDKLFYVKENNSEFGLFDLNSAKATPLKRATADKMDFAYASDLSRFFYADRRTAGTQTTVNAGIISSKGDTLKQYTFSAKSYNLSNFCISSDSNTLAFTDADENGVNSVYIADLKDINKK